MSDNYDDIYDSDEDLNLDTLLNETDQLLGVEPSDESGSFSPPAAENADFTPDFGAAFDDYGEYEDAPLPTPLGDYQTDEYDYDDEEDGDDSPPEKPKRKGKRRLVPLFVKVLLYLVIVGIAAVGLGYGVWECAQDVLAFGRSDEMLTVTIEEGATLDDIAQMLEDNGVIKYP